MKLFFFQKICISYVFPSLRQVWFFMSTLLERLRVHCNKTVTVVVSTLMFEPTLDLTFYGLGYWNPVCIDPSG